MMAEMRLERTIQRIEAAMDLLSARRRLIASNVANAETPGYKAVDLDFRSQLIQASEEGATGARLIRTDERHMGAPTSMGRGLPVVVRAENTGEARADGNTVELEKEVVKMAGDQIRFQALTQALNRVFSTMKEAIAEGGRR